jgi:glycosyltransferase involved in cell wall biosynthesis
MSEPFLSVAISTFRRAAGLGRLLEALRPQVEGRPAREILVVNDGSHDAAYQIVVQKFANVVSYRPLPENVGIARARNAVAALARGDYLVFTDDDCVPPSSWLDWLEARLDANPEIDVLIGTTQPRLPDRPRFIERVNGHYALIPAPHGTPAMPLFVTANVAIRRELFERVGRFGFTQAFPAGEDTELASRLSASGARIVVDPHWFVCHDVSDGLFRQIRRYWRYGYANVRMCELTTAPGPNARLAQARRRYHVANAIEQLRANLQTAEGFSRWTLVRWCSAVAASCVQIAFYDGCAAAAAARRRELRI